MGGIYLKTDDKKGKPTLISEVQLNLIKQYLESLQYGQVILTIQDGNLIQIEKNEKVRLK